ASRWRGSATHRRRPRIRTPGPPPSGPCPASPPPTRRHAPDRRGPRRRHAGNPSSRWRSSRRAACRSRRAARQSPQEDAAIRRGSRSRYLRAPGRSRPRAWRAAPPTTKRAQASAERGRRPCYLRSLRKLREVGLALLHVRIAALLGLFAEVVEEGRVTGELLD